jgi:predicted amidophosphoribosyltransferase
MARSSTRLRREARTLTAMVEIACHGMHGTAEGQLCPSCDALLEYALARLDRCPFQEAKPTCAKCPIHCYRPAQRAQIRAVMRYAGPRMLLHHPMLALYHLWDGLRKPPRARPRP